MLREDPEHSRPPASLDPAIRLLEDPVEIQAARDVSRKAGEQKPIRDDYPSVPERRQDCMVDAVAKIGRVGKNCI